MNEVILQNILNAMYELCNRIEIALEENEIPDDYTEYFQDLYDNIFNLTTDIELEFGILDLQDF